MLCFFQCIFYVLFYLHQAFTSEFSPFELLIHKYYPSSIGTFNNYNSFSLDKDLVGLDIFSQFLDHAHLKRHESNSYYIY